MGIRNRTIVHLKGDKMSETYTGSENKLVSSAYLYNILQSLKTKYINNKVDKVNGYGLSKNDLTDALKKKYDASSTKAHSHDNSDTLNKITENDLINWNSKLSAELESNELDLTTLL